MGSQNNNRAPEINTGYPGFAYNFDPDKQTCDVQLAIENLFIGMIDPYKLVKKERLLQVKVQFIQGGNWSLTHPVPDGTPVYVHFAQRGIDHFIVEGKDAAGMVHNKPAPAFSQLFSHHSAVCVVGIVPDTSAIKGFNNEVFELRNGDRSKRVTLSDGNIVILAKSTKITVSDEGEVVIEAPKKATVVSPEILLDGNTTVTKKLTVQGGMEVSGGSGVSFQIKGDSAVLGSFKVNGTEVDKHTHTNPEGGDVGPMK